MNEGVNAKRIETSFENSIARLERAVNQACADHNEYRGRIGKLDIISDDPIKTSAKNDPNDPEEEVPDTLLYKLNILINELELNNHKNANLISFFNTLI